ncbi:MAG: purH [Candidatus Krumholzibacteriota bacterium]|nr:purH [Candidatus Krumholzibacteriota bacterium]
MNDKVQTALISVTDKGGLVPLCAALKKRGVTILSSSGTKKFLEENGFDVVEISAYTESPELLGGRVKTLHPKIHAGILADRGNPEHMKDLRERGVRPIDLVVVNLYPFREKYAAGGLSEEDLCEFIDIGGITLIRAAAKNFHHVTVVTRASQYAEIVRLVDESGGIPLDHRRRLAREAFSLTSAYDAAIGRFFSANAPEEGLPEEINIALERVTGLRYGENPHQTAAVYRTIDDSPLVSFEMHQGKELSYNNYLDVIGAFSLARDIGENGVTIVKHTNPCGAAWCGDVLRSFRRALATDRVSAFGGIVGVNGAVEKALAEELNQLFLEVVVARSYSPEALEIIKKKKNVRVLRIPERFWSAQRSAYTGILVENVCLMQSADADFPEIDTMKVVTRRAPTAAELAACKMAWKVAKHVKSNAIVIGDEEGTVGVGAGQMSRVDSAQIATRKAFDAGFSLSGKVAASDAYFPFADGVTTLARAGITAVVQPGGSIRDQETIDAADAANLAMLFTGRRHFRHV